MRYVPAAALVLAIVAAGCDDPADDAGCSAATCERVMELCGLSPLGMSWSCDWMAPAGRRWELDVDRCRAACSAFGLGSRYQCISDHVDLCVRGNACEEPGCEGEAFGELIHACPPPMPGPWDPACADPCQEAFGACVADCPVDTWDACTDCQLECFRNRRECQEGCPPA